MHTAQVYISKLKESRCHEGLRVDGIQHLNVTTTPSLQLPHLLSQPVPMWHPHFLSSERLVVVVSRDRSSQYFDEGICFPHLQAKRRPMQAHLT